MRGLTAKLGVDEDKRELARLVWHPESVIQVHRDRPSLSEHCYMQSRLEALESGVDEDAVHIDEDDDEFELETVTDASEGSGTDHLQCVHKCSWSSWPLHESISNARSGELRYN